MAFLSFEVDMIILMLLLDLKRNERFFNHALAFFETKC
jgi:hypothetical protein